MVALADHRPQLRPDPVCPRRPVGSRDLHQEAAGGQLHLQVQGLPHGRLRLHERLLVAGDQDTVPKCEWTHRGERPHQESAFVRFQREPVRVAGADVQLPVILAGEHRGLLGSVVLLQGVIRALPHLGSQGHAQAVGVVLPGHRFGDPEEVAAVHQGVVLDRRSPGGPDAFQQRGPSVGPVQLEPLDA